LLLARRPNEEISFPSIVNVLIIVSRPVISDGFDGPEDVRLLAVTEAACDGRKPDIRQFAAHFSTREIVESTGPLVPASSTGHRLQDLFQ
jgi:hypothetical protein